MNELFSKKYALDLILGAILICYIVFPIKTPPVIANMVKTPIGIIILVVIAVLLFSIVHPIIAVIFLVSAFQLLDRSNTNLFVNNDNPLSNKNMSPSVNEYKNIDNLPVTLEQEIIKSRVPLVNDNYVNSTATYKPILETNYNFATTN
jgi:hypothetical protein